jgi:hypothetical protein
MEKYISDITYIHHVVYPPSLLAVVDQLYADLAGGSHIRPGHASLVLSVLASTTYSWAPEDCGINCEFFPTATIANDQAPLWVKATLDMLEHQQRSSSTSIEALQAIIIVSFIICNMEGLSHRYRSMIATALTMARELGLHRLDQKKNAEASGSQKPNIVEAETGRRVWWYLAATDW